MKVNDAISGGFFILFAIAIFYFTKDFRLMPGQNYGASFFPRTIATAMGFLGLILVFQGMRNKGSEPWVQALDWVASPRHVANFVLVIAVLIFYILFSGWLGFLVAGFICILSLLIWLRGPEFWLKSLVLSVICVIALQYFFGELLRVPLPWGILRDLRW